MEKRTRIEVTADYRLADHFQQDEYQCRIVKDVDFELKSRFKLDCGDVQFINCKFSGLHSINIGNRSSLITFTKCELNRGTAIVNSDRIILESCTGAAEINGGCYVSINDAAHMECIYITEVYFTTISDALPDILHLSRCQRLTVNDANNAKDNCLICVYRMSGSGLTIYGSKLPNTKLDIKKSNVEYAEIYNSEVDKIAIEQSVIEWLRVDANVGQLISYDSVCHLHQCDNSVKLKLASRPQTFVNSQFTMYKKVFIKSFFSQRLDEAILELNVPQDAEIVPPFNSNQDEQGKMRVSKAMPVGLFTLAGDPITRLPFWKQIISTYDSKYKYRIWKIAKPKEAFDPITKSCGSGIHGFLTFKEARNY